MTSSTQRGGKTECEESGGQRSKGQRKPGGCRTSTYRGGEEGSRRVWKTLGMGNTVGVGGVRGFLFPHF